MAAGAVVTAAVLGEAWRGEPGEPAILGQAAKAAATSPVASAPTPPVDATTPQTAAPPSVSPPTVAMPSFDIALIGPDGRGVIAGRAQPGAKIILLDGDKELAQDQADAHGEWVIIAQDPPLTAGPHELRVVQHVDGRAPVTTDQVVVAIVPDQKQSGPKKKTLVMIAPSSGAATLVQPPSAAGVVVVRGDSLWNIARARYGTGFRPTLIYGANKDQIRDPDLIYPGQVFNLPKIN
jgi:nucleoid-associated protein YgaU